MIKETIKQLQQELAMIIYNVYEHQLSGFVQHLKQMQVIIFERSH